MNENSHRTYYNEDRIEIPSCTKIVGMLNKPSLVDWANYMGFKRINTKAFLEERANYGTYCHTMFERYFVGLITTIGGGNILSPEEYKEIVFKFRMIELYFEKFEIEILDMELAMEGSTYGGTLDMICYNRIKDCIMIFDLKTSKQIYDTHWIQLMGYVDLVEEVYNLPVEEVGIILLSKPRDSKDLVNIRKTKDCWREQFIFRKLKELYYMVNGTIEDINRLTKEGETIGM